MLDARQSGLSGEQVRGDASGFLSGVVTRRGATGCDERHGILAGEELNTERAHDGGERHCAEPLEGFGPKSWRSTQKNATQRIERLESD